MSPERRGPAAREGRTAEAMCPVGATPAAAARVRRRWRGALVGCGRMGAAHAERIAAHPDGDLALVWDADPTRAATLAERHRAEVARGLEDLLEPGRADWGLVATPPASHRAVATRLLRAGVAVLCEKPLARSPGEARTLLAAASDAGATLRTATKYPRVPDVVRARRLLHEGAIGELRRVEIVFAAPLDPRADWRADPLTAGGGVLIDNGPHAFDLLEFLAGPVAAIAAEEGPRAWGSAVEEDVRLDVAGRAGWEGIVRLSWTRAAAGPDYARVTGTDGEIRLGWKVSALVRGGESRPFGPGYAKAAAMDDQLSAFYRTLEGVAGDGADRGLRDLELVEAAYLALAGGGRVPAPPEAPAP